MAIAAVAAFVGVVILYFVLSKCLQESLRGDRANRNARNVPPRKAESTESELQGAYNEFQEVLSKSLRFRCGNKIYVPFFTYHIKKLKWPCIATVELINNFIAFALTIALLIDQNIGIAIASFVSLVMGQLIVHFTYGYNRYANPGNGLIADIDSRFKEEFEVSIANFDVERRIFDYMYHGKSTPSNKDKCTISCFGCLFQFLNDTAVIMVCMAIFLAIIKSYCGGTILTANEASTNPNSQERNFAFLILLVLLLLASSIVELAFVTSGAIGSIVGAVFWASLSIAGSFTGILPLVIVSNIMLFLIEEYYTALLFNKTPSEMGKSILFNVFYDVFSELEIIGSELPDNPKAVIDIEANKIQKPDN
jgi:hypothetical protein